MEIEKSRRSVQIQTRKKTLDHRTSLDIAFLFSERKKTAERAQKIGFKVKKPRNTDDIDDLIEHVDSR